MPEIIPALCDDNDGTPRVLRRLSCHSHLCEYLRITWWSLALFKGRCNLYTSILFPMLIRDDIKANMCYMFVVFSEYLYILDSASAVFPIIRPICLKLSQPSCPTSGELFIQ